jgi:hypothetical protein
MKENTRPPQNTMNKSQPLVERYQVDIEHPQSSSQVQYINEARTSKNLDTIVLANHETSNGIQEISINYTNYAKLYDRSTTIVNSCFSIVIVERIPIDSDPKTNVILTSSRIFPVGFKWVFI